MSIEVVLRFDDAQKAVEALNKLAGVTVAPVETVTSVTESTEKPKAGKGKGKGKTKTKTEAAPKEETVEAADQAKPTFAEVRAALQKVGAIEGKGISIVAEILAEFVEDPMKRKVSAVPEDRYVEFIARCNKEVS